MARVHGFSTRFTGFQRRARGFRNALNGLRSRASAFLGGDADHAGQAPSIAPFVRTGTTLVRELTRGYMVDGDE